jgi:glycosyltransferase involved in cell wall biosynthesis
VKILFISRATLYKDKGGDTIQVLNTAKFLKRLGIGVEIRLCNETIDYTPFDLIHFFNIIRPADILLHLKKSCKSFVISTIFVDYSEYEKKERNGLAGFIFRTFSPDVIEYAKVLARSIVNHEKIISPEYLWLGHRKAVQKIIRQASLLLPNSESEYRRLVDHFKIKSNYRVIPNAIDPEIFVAPTISDRNERLVLCVGRIEGRKNQLNLIKAVNNTDFELVIIGSPSPNQANYYEQCKILAGKNIKFIQALDQQQLSAYYSRAKVHALPSWFETTGLSSLEAGAMGCNIVITDKGDTWDYFEDNAFYCDPSSPASILGAIEEAASNDIKGNLRKGIMKKYTWTETARKTLESYQEVLKDIH